MATNTSPRFYRPELDALRLFAFLCVFVHHLRKHYAGPAESAQPRDPAAGLHPSAAQTLHASLASGVSLFFFLSAYLILTLLLLEREQTGAIGTRTFYLRRILRICPLYFSYLTLVLALGALLPSVRMAPQETLAYALFYGNWFNVRHAWGTVILAGMLWSISIDEQFYLFAPIAVRLSSRRSLAALSAALMLASCGLLVWFGIHGHAADSTLRPNTFVQMLFLAAGALTATLLGPRSLPIAPALRPALLLAGLSTWYLGYRLFTAGAPLDPLMQYLLLLAGVVLIFFAFHGLPVKWLPPSILYLGRISYGLYIWHMLALWSLDSIPALHGSTPRAVLHYALALALTVAFASASYAWIEAPCLQRKERFAPRQSISTIPAMRRDPLDVAFL